MFELVFESMRKASESAVGLQQEMFRKWFGQWPTMSPPVFGEPMKFPKKWVDLVGELIKKQQQSVQAQFSVGLRYIEEAFRLGEAKNPEELRAKTIELWQKMFDCLRQTYEAQARDFQTAMAKCTELLTKGAA